MVSIAHAPSPKAGAPSRDVVNFPRRTNPPSRFNTQECYCIPLTIHFPRAKQRDSAVAPVQTTCNRKHSRANAASQLLGSLLLYLPAPPCQNSIELHRCRNLLERHVNLPHFAIQALVAKRPATPE